MQTLNSRKQNTKTWNTINVAIIQQQGKTLLDELGLLKLNYTTIVVFDTHAGVRL